MVVGAVHVLWLGPAQLSCDRKRPSVLGPGLVTNWGLQFLPCEEAVMLFVAPPMSTSAVISVVDGPSGDGYTCDMVGGCDDVRTH